MSNLERLQESIRNGQEPAWTKIVRTLLSGRTSGMKFAIREARVILAVWMGNNDWQTLVGAPLTKEKPYERIASFYQESSTPPTMMLTANGELTFIGEADGEMMPAVVPLGTVFIGQFSDGSWADEIALVEVNVFADILGKPLQEVVNNISEQAGYSANSRIEKLTGTTFTTREQMILGAA